MPRKKKQTEDAKISKNQAEEEQIELKHVEHLPYKMLPIDDVVPNEWNPSEMSEDLFNFLVDNLNELGMAQPILVTPIKGSDGTPTGKYRIIDGEQRYQGLKLFTDATEIPCIIKEDIDETKQRFQTVRMNRLRGQLNKKKFQVLVQELLDMGYSIPDIEHNMAFPEPREFESLVEDVSAGLEGKIKKEFDAIKHEIKSVEDLTRILNKLFSKYGDSLDYNYMIFDFGGKQHLWVRLEKASDFKLIKEKFLLCQQHEVTVSSAIRLLIKKGLTEKFITQFKDQLDTPEPKTLDLELNQEFLDRLEETAGQ